MLTETQTPQAQLVTNRVKRMPADALRWLLELRSYSQSDQMITGLEVTDGDLRFVLVTPATWRRIDQTMNGPHRARWEAEREAAKRQSADGPV